MQRNAWFHEANWRSCQRSRKFKQGNGIVCIIRSFSTVVLFNLFGCISILPVWYFSSVHSHTIWDSNMMNFVLLLYCHGIDKFIWYVYRFVNANWNLQFCYSFGSFRSVSFSLYSQTECVLRYIAILICSYMLLAVGLQRAFPVSRRWNVTALFRFKKKITTKPLISLEK